MFAFYMRKWKLLLRSGHSTRGRLRGQRIRNGDFLKQVYRVDQWALQDVAWSPAEQRSWRDQKSLPGKKPGRAAASVGDPVP
eukprot:9811157-Prorocentrum_lima.AAC.1